MTKQPLQKLFDAMYHGKHNFEDFLHSPMSQNYEAIKLTPSSKRKILKPKEILKVYHKFLSLFIFDYLPINERVVFSYRKGFSAFHAVEKHRNNRYFFQTDIKSFFGSIDGSLIRSAILSGANSSPVSDILQHSDRIIELVCVDNSLPVGFPSSAPLSNVALFKFDNEMESFCNEQELTYSRYADDIIISGNKKGDTFAIENLVQDNLLKYASRKLKINYAKTRHFQTGGKVKILGMMILPNGKVSAETRRKKELEVLIHFYITSPVKFNEIISKIKAKSGKSVNLIEGDGLDVLSGSLNYIDSIDPDYTNKLRRKYGVTTIDMLMYRGFSKRS
jgi:RNA-directed DNA polymerase